MKINNLVIFVVGILILGAIAGCGANDSGSADQASSANEDQEETENRESETDTQAVREIEHAMGTTEIEGTPERIVTLYQGANDAAVALGVTPVGVVDSWVEKPMYRYLRDDLKGVPHVGLETQPNLEEISKLNPDLIIASTLRHEKVYDQLSQIAPTVAHETVFRFKETVQLMGKAMNKQEKAEQLLSDWDERVADFKTKIKEKRGENWPVEVSVLNFRADHARIYVTGFAGSILKELGFERPEVQQNFDKAVMQLTSKESIPKMNADVFFIFNSDAGDDAERIQQTYEAWTGHPLWENLDAVQNEHVYQVDDVVWNMGGGILAANAMLDQVYEHFELQP